MDEIDIETFTADPMVLVLNSLKKADLLAIMQHYKLPSEERKCEEINSVILN